MPTTTWLGCILVAVCLVHSVSSRAARLPIDDATRRALDRLTLYLEEIGQDTAPQERPSQYRSGYDFVKPIPRLSSTGQTYTVELPRDNSYIRSRFGSDRAGSRTMPQPPQRFPTADVGSFLEYLENALQHTDNDVLGKNALSANKRQPPSGFHAVRGKRSTYS